MENGEMPYDESRGWDRSALHRWLGERLGRREDTLKGVRSYSSATRHHHLGYYPDHLGGASHNQ